MSTYHVRVAGNVYGPFSHAQLVQMATAGRVNGQTEISTDRINWTLAASVLGAANSPSPSPVPTAARGTAAGDNQPLPRGRKYLETLRNNSRYPFYRTTVLICSIFGYLIAAAPILGLFFKIVWRGLSSVEIYEPFGAIIAGVFIMVFVTVLREMFSMYADFVDSTIDYHSRNGS